MSTPPPDDPGRPDDVVVPEEGERFRLGYVPGATPARWVRTWRDRLPDVPLELVALEPADAAAALRDGRADAAVLRLPVDKDVLAAIPLYEEQPVVLVSRDHLLAALDEQEEVDVADLAGDVLLQPLDDVVPWDGPVPGRPAVEAPATTADAVVLVAAGVGVLVVPQSLARLHHRKDVTFRRLTGAPTAPVGLAWVADAHTDLVEEMVGIVRGRTANSSRGSARSAARPSDDARPGRQEKDVRSTGTGSGGRSTGGGRSAGGRPAGGRSGGGAGRSGAGRAGGGRSGGQGGKGAKGTKGGRGASGRGRRG